MPTGKVDAAPKGGGRADPTSTNGTAKSSDREAAVLLTSVAHDSQTAAGGCDEQKLAIVVTVDRHEASAHPAEAAVAGTPAPADAKATGETGTMASSTAVAGAEAAGASVGGGGSVAGPTADLHNTKGAAGEAGSSQALASGNGAAARADASADGLSARAAEDPVPMEVAEGAAPLAEQREGETGPPPPPPPLQTECERQL